MRQSYICTRCIRGSLHESGLSFNPKRHSKLNSCLHGRLSWGLKDHGEWRSHSGLKLVSDSCTNNLIFPAILALIHLNTWIKLPILQAIFISAIMNVDFIPSFIQEWNFDPSLHDSQSTFHSGVFNPEWKMEWTRSGMSCNSIRIHVNKYNSILCGLSRNGMTSIRIETQSGFI